MADTSSRPASPDALPPVEPPSAAFLVQLFLVPAIIVSIIVFVWLAFHWLAQLGNDPEGYVKTLRRDSEGRWQAALNLANDLRGPGGAALKENVQLASELGLILDDEVSSGRLAGAGNAAEQSRTLCTYLCRALGEFAVPEAAPPLVARTSADDPQVARAALEALAVLADNLSHAGGFTDPGAVEQAVIAASRSDDPLVRSRAAYALGVVGGAGARERLRELCGEAAEDVRSNAALGLARLGDLSAYETLGEMLAQPDPEAVPGDDLAQARRYKRALVVVNALKGVGLLVDGTREPPPGELVERIRALASDPVVDVRTGAAALAAKLDRIANGAGVP